MEEQFKFHYSGTKTADYNSYEMRVLDPLINSFSIKVEYHWSVDYCVKNKDLMTSNHSKVQKTSVTNTHKTAKPKNDFIQSWLSKKKLMVAENNTLYGDGGSGGDIFDFISRKDDVPEKNDEKCVKIADQGVENSDDDCSNCSFVSGPSSPWPSKKLQLSKDLCLPCTKLYLKSKKMKTPIIDKSLDNDPSSLTCDQWVLLKKWRPRWQPRAKRKLVVLMQLVQERLADQFDAKVNKRCSEDAHGSGCSRPHTFLRRNLRRCVKVPKKTRKKRARGDFQYFYTAKKRRLRGNYKHQHASVKTAKDSRLNSQGHSPDPEDTHKGQNESGSIPEMTRAMITMETNEPELTTQRKEVSGATFTDLLTDLYHSCSNIVKERQMPL